MFGWEFPPFHTGGLGPACYGLAKGLYKKGVKITFILPKKININSDFLKFVYADIKFHYVNSLLKPYMTSKGYHESFTKQDNGKNAYGATLFLEVERFAENARGIAERENFDLIHAHDWMTFKAGVEAKKVSKKPLVVHVHSTEFERTGGNGVNQRVYDIEKYGFDNADVVITVSNFTKKHVVKYYGINPDKVKVVHNAIDFENSKLNAIHKLKEGNKIILFLGRVTLQKGPDYFVYAAKKVLERCQNAFFVVVGTGDMESFVINKAAELGIADRVLFAGFAKGDDVHKAYQMADVYVMPSVAEPFGLTPLESLINGTPVIISRQSGVSEVLSNCLKVDFWDINEIANKIISVLQYPELHKALVDNGVSEVKRMKWEDSAQKCVEIYGEVTGAD